MEMLIAGSLLALAGQSALTIATGLGGVLEPNKVNRMVGLGVVVFGLLCAAAVCFLARHVAWAA